MFDRMMALWESPTSARAVEKAFPGKRVLVWTIDTEIQEVDFPIPWKCAQDSLTVPLKNVSRNEASIISSGMLFCGVLEGFKSN